MLRDTVLTVITQHPGISAKQLRQRLAPATMKQVHSVIGELRKSGAITQTSHGHYRAGRSRAPSGAPDRIERGQPLRLLMAGR
jgi:hypothetical protein